MSEAAHRNPQSVRQTGPSAKEQAAAAAGQAVQATGEVAGTAVQQARAVADEARQQAATAMGELREHMADQVQHQTDRAAGTLRQWADDLAGLARRVPSSSPVRTLAAQAADGGHRAAEYLDKRGAGGMVEDLQGFARRRPGAFLGAAALAGLAVGRMVKAGSTAARPWREPLQAPARGEGPSGLPPGAVAAAMSGHPEV